MSTHRILLVEDELPLAQTLAAYLEREQFQVRLISDGAEVLDAFKRGQPSMVLLDLSLPHVDGMTLCREIRQISDVPIIILTARVEEIDRLLGLEIGADDYVCKPYSPREVVARVKAVLRRSRPGSQAASAALTIDSHAMEALIQGRPLGLTAVEFRLLETMVREPRRVFSRDQLMANIYTDHRIVSDRTIDSHITKLRRKISTAADGRDYIGSVYGAGYRYDPPPDSD